MTLRPRIIVVGANGQVGWELVNVLQSVGEVVPLTRADLDLADVERISRIITPLRPDLIVNTAAYTMVDGAETNEAVAYRVNCEAVGAMGRAARDCGASVVQFSTDYVFDGTLERAYREDDATNPLNVYGRTKLAGEQALAESGASHLIIRTSWIYALRGHNFLRAILQRLSAGDELHIVDDQFGVPTWAGWLADAVAQVLKRTLAAKSFQGAPTSFTPPTILHLVGDGATSWYEFAQAIAEESGISDLAAGRIHPIHSASYPSPAVRPPRAILDGRLAETHYGVARMHWRRQLEMALKR